MVGGTGCVSGKHFCGSVITHYDTFILRLQSIVGSPRGSAAPCGSLAAFFGLQVMPTASKCGVTGVLFATAFASIPPPTGRENPPDSPDLSHRKICGFFDGDGDTESVCCQPIRLVRQPQERVTLLSKPAGRRLTFVLISSARLV